MQVLHGQIGCSDIDIHKIFTVVSGEDELFILT
jgi:hypothetical protein